jgi:hypothetical protein
MSARHFTVTRAQARDIKRIDERTARLGGVAPDVIHGDWLEDMAAELRQMAKTFERTGRGAKELLEGLFLAEVEGVDARVLAEIRRSIGEKVRKKRAA